MSTAQKIIQAATILMREKGYQGVTTKAIAVKAGVNESTVFRHFKNKQGILEAIIDQHSYIPQFSRILKEEATDEPETDLLKLYRHYHAYFHENADLITIGFRDLGMFPKLDQKLAELPIHLHALLVEYLTRLVQKGVIPEQDIQTSAMTFLSMCFGFQMGQLIHFRTLSLDERSFYEHSVKLFVRGIR